METGHNQRVVVLANIPTLINEKFCEEMSNRASQDQDKVLNMALLSSRVEPRKLLIVVPEKGVCHNVTILATERKEV